MGPRLLSGLMIKAEMQLLLATAEIMPRRIRGGADWGGYIMKTCEWTSIRACILGWGQ